MPIREVPTLRQFNVPVVLVVGASERLLGVVSDIAVGAQVLVSECSPETATDTAASMRPLVMVIPEEIYALDGHDFDALARDVRAKILRVTSAAPTVDELQAELLALMQEAEQQRPSWTDELAPE